MATETKKPNEVVETDNATDFANELKSQTAAVRVQKQAMYLRRALSRDQRTKAADVFGADGDSISAGKRLLNSKDPAYRKVTHIQYAANAYWKAVTVPYPINGIRLINRSNIERFEDRMQEFASDLAEAASELQGKYDELREEARARLGDLFDERDYPDDIAGEFGLEWDYPSVEPPEYLKKLNPKLYERESERITARFDEAVAMAEEMFASELSKLVEHLIERLQADPETGKRRVFRNSAIENLSDFFGRFRELSIGSNRELDRIVDMAEKLVNNVSPEDLRNSSEMREKVKQGLGVLKGSLDSLLVEEGERTFAFDEE